MPAVSPVTKPALLIVATEGEAELQVPPVTESDRLVVAPVQAVGVPVIAPADGVAFTVTNTVALRLPQLLVSV